MSSCDSYEKIFTILFSVDEVPANLEVSSYHGQ